jgi:hypothetical protein
MGAESVNYDIISYTQTVLGEFPSGGRNGMDQSGSSSTHPLNTGPCTARFTRLFNQVEGSGGNYVCATCT